MPDNTEKSFTDIPEMQQDEVRRGHIVAVPSTGDNAGDWTKLDPDILDTVNRQIFEGEGLPTESLGDSDKLQYYFKTDTPQQIYRSASGETTWELFSRQVSVSVIDSDDVDQSILPGDGSTGGNTFTLTPDPVFTSLTDNDIFIFETEHRVVVDDVFIIVNEISARELVQPNGDSIPENQLTGNVVVYAIYNSDDDNFKSLFYIETTDIDFLPETENDEIRDSQLIVIPSTGDNAGRRTRLNIETLETTYQEILTGNGTPLSSLGNENKNQIYFKVDEPERIYHSDNGESEWHLSLFDPIYFPEDDVVQDSDTRNVTLSVDGVDRYVKGMEIVFESELAGLSDGIDVRINDLDWVDLVRADKQEFEAGEFRTNTLYLAVYDGEFFVSNFITRPPLHTVSEGQVRIHGDNTLIVADSSITRFESGDPVINFKSPITNTGNVRIFVSSAIPDPDIHSWDTLNYRRLLRQDLEEIAPGELVDGQWVRAVYDPAHSDSIAPFISDIQPYSLVTTSGDTVPENPRNNDRHTYNTSVSSLENHVGSDGTTEITSAISGDTFRYDSVNTHWVLQIEGTRTDDITIDRNSDNELQVKSDSLDDSHVSDSIDNTGKQSYRNKIGSINHTVSGSVPDDANINDLHTYNTSVSSLENHTENDSITEITSAVSGDTFKFDGMDWVYQYTILSLDNVTIGRNSDNELQVKLGSLDDSHVSDSIDNTGKQSYRNKIGSINHTVSGSVPDDANINDLHTYDIDVSSLENHTENDSTTEITSAISGDTFKFDGTNWVFQYLVGITIDDITIGQDTNNQLQVKLGSLDDSHVSDSIDNAGKQSYRNKIGSINHTVSGSVPDDANTNDLHTYTTSVSSLENHTENDSTTEITSVILGDTFKFNGTDWVFQYSIDNITIEYNSDNRLQIKLGSLDDSHVSDSIDNAGKQSYRNKIGSINHTISGSVPDDVNTNDLHTYDIDVSSLENHTENDSTTEITSAVSGSTFKFDGTNWVFQYIIAIDDVTIGRNSDNELQVKSGSLTNSHISGSLDDTQKSDYRNKIGAVGVISLSSDEANHVYAVNNAGTGIGLRGLTTRGIEIARSGVLTIDDGHTGQITTTNWTLHANAPTGFSVSGDVLTIPRLPPDMTDGLWAVLRKGNTEYDATAIMWGCGGGQDDDDFSELGITSSPLGWDQDETLDVRYAKLGDSTNIQLYADEDELGSSENVTVRIYLKGVFFN